jgi:hypothetical protein
VPTQRIRCREISETDLDAVAELLTRGFAGISGGAPAIQMGKVSGLTGFHSNARGRKYFKGPHRPRLAGLTDTELVLYGP